MNPVIANAFLSPAFLRNGAALRERLQTAAVEMTTLKQTDIGKSLRGDFNALAGIDHRLAQLNGYQAATRELVLKGGVIQSALTAISDKAQELAGNLLTTAALSDPQRLAAVTLSGAQSFTQVVSILNSRFSDRAVFGGVQSDQPPLPEAGEILQAMELALLPAASAADLSASIDSWFMSGSGYEDLYQGGAIIPSVPVGAGDAAGYDISALNPAIRKTLAGFAKLALIERGAMAGAMAERADLALRAGSDLQASAADRAYLAGKVGITEQFLARVEARNSAEKAALEMQKNALVSVDPYEAAVRLRDLEGLIDAFYTITGRLSRLSLSDYMR